MYVAQLPESAAVPKNSVPRRLCSTLQQRGEAWRCRSLHPVSSHGIISTWSQRTRTDRGGIIPSKAAHKKIKSVLSGWGSYPFLVFLVFVLRLVFAVKTRGEGFNYPYNIIKRSALCPFGTMYL